MDPEEISNWISDASRETGAMTASEVKARLEEADLRVSRAIDDIGRAENLAEADIGSLERTLERMQESREGYPTIDIAAIQRVHGCVRRANRHPTLLSLVIPERDFFKIQDEMDTATSLGDQDRSSSTMRICNIEILRGVRDPDADIGVYFGWKMIESDRKALLAEILRCLGRGSVAELPQSASSNRVSPSAKTVSEVGVTARAAGRDNRDSNRPADLSDEAKIIAAKHAISVYARDKKLPSAEALAIFGELDRTKAGRGAAAVGVDLAKPGADRTVRWWLAKRSAMAPVSLPTSEELCRGFGGRQYDFIAFDEATDLGCGAPANINRHAHRLSSESLSRAADQIWGANSSGSYADLVCSRAERLAEMVYRGDAAADGQGAK